MGLWVCPFPRGAINRRRAAASNGLPVEERAKPLPRVEAWVWLHPEKPTSGRRAAADNGGLWRQGSRLEEWAWRRLGGATNRKRAGAGNSCRQVEAWASFHLQCERNGCLWKRAHRPLIRTYVVTCVNNAPVIDHGRQPHSQAKTGQISPPP